MNTPSRHEYDNLALLLPLYVNNELTAEERLSVERGLEASPELRAELNEVRGIQSLVDDFGSQLPLDIDAAEADRRFASIMNRIRAEPDRDNPEVLAGAVSLWERLAATIDRVLMPVAKPVMAVAIGVIVIQGIMLTRDGSASYRSLSGPEVGTVSADGPSVLVRFAPAASISEVTELLATLDLLIVFGPEEGVFVITPGNNNAGTSAEIAEQLTQSALVELAIERGENE